jgi:GNAT superfamily N-acetyltransferase
MNRSANPATNPGSGRARPGDAARRPPAGGVLTSHTDSTVAIRDAEPGDAATVVDVLVDAFLPDPVADWLIAHEPTGRQVYPAYSQMMFDYTLTHGGTIHVTADRSGAAVWLPHTDTTIGDGGVYERLLADACGMHADRFRLLNATLAHHQPQQPHHYLAYLGVTFSRRNRGTGSRLLAHQHATLDAENTPAYLVATTTRSRDLYLRHGYQPRPAIRLPLAGGPTLWPMWRDPWPPDIETTRRH